MGQLRAKFHWIAFACILPALAPACAAASVAELIQQADLARKSNDLPGAVKLYRDALAQDASSQLAWWYLGGCLYAEQNFSDALQAFQSLLKLNPEMAPARALLGLTEVQTGDFANALADIDRALSSGANSGIQPQLKDVLATNKALLLSRSGHFDQSLRILSTFARTEPDPNLLLALGIALLRRPILPSAVPPAEQDMVTRAGRAFYLMLSGSADAEAAFRALCADYPQARNVHYALGYFLLKHDTEAAAAAFKQELALDPNNADAGAMFAYAKLAGNDARAAVPFAERAVTLSPGSSSAHYVLGRVLLSIGKPQEAVAALESAEKLDPDNIEDHIALAGAYLQTSRFADAKRERHLALHLQSRGSGE